MAVKGSPGKPAQRFFGKSRPKVAGYGAWLIHNHADHWGDGGAAEKFGQEIGQSVAEKARTVIAEQTREAVALTSANGHLIVAVNMENDGARLVIQVPLAELINAAIKDAFGNAMSAASQDFLSTLISTAGTMANLKKELISAQGKIAQSHVDEAVA
jgi:hypothetical protein